MDNRRKLQCNDTNTKEEACPCITDVQDTAAIGGKKKATFRWLSASAAEETLSSSVFAPRKEELTDSSHVLLLIQVSIFRSCRSMWQESTPSEVTRRGQGEYPKNQVKSDSCNFSLLAVSYEVHY